MIQKLKYVFVVLNLIGGLLFVLTPALALADSATPEPCLDINGQHYAHPKDTNGTTLAGCSKIKTPGDCPSNVVDQTDKTKCKALGNSCDKKTEICTGNPILQDLNKVVDVLAGLVGVVVVGTIILGGIQFAAAGDKAEAVSAAKHRIINGLTALLAFLFIYAFLQWLIPGGIFK